MAYSDAEFLKIDLELNELFKKRGIPKLPTPTPKTVSIFRQNYSKALQRFNSSPFARHALALPSGKATWIERDDVVQVSDGSEIKVRIYVPNELPSDGAAVGVIYHAGGWYMGDLETDAFLCHLFCAKFGMIMVNIDYRRYPDAPFPVPITDCYDALQWTATNAPSFGGNLSKGFVVGGTSGGGTFASIASHLAREEKPPLPLTGCFLLCPILTDECIGNDGERYHRFGDRIRSFEQNKDAPLMTKAMADSIEDFATFDWSSPLLTPFNFAHHRNVCPTYVQVCGLDPWRDTGIIYGEILREAGAEVKMDTYPGLPHCWWTTFWTLKANQTWLRNVLDGMRWLLERRDNFTTGPRL